MAVRESMRVLLVVMSNPNNTTSTDSFNYFPFLGFDLKASFIYKKICQYTAFNLDKISPSLQRVFFNTYE